MTEASAPSRRTAAFATLAFALCLAAAAILFAETISPTRSIFGHDTVSHDYGMLLWAVQAMGESGRLPLWNPYLFGGIPTLGSFAVNPFNLQSLLLPILPFPLAFTFYYLIAFAIGGTGMALLLRKIGCGPWPALIIAIVFTLSGHFTTLAHAGHLTKAAAFAWVPWLFFLAEIWFERPSWGRACLMALPLAGMILASHLQIVYLAGVFLGLWWIGRLITEKPRRPAAIAVQTTQIAAACAFAGILGAAQLLPGLEMAPISNRSAGVAHDEAARTSYPPEDLMEYVLPGWLGANFPDSANPYLGHWGGSMAERIVSDYFGLCALFLALIALPFSRDHRRWIWLAIACLGIWIALGVYAGMWQVLRHVPGFASFRSPAVALGWTTMGALVLAGMGLDTLWKNRPRFLRMLAAVILIEALLAIAWGAATGAVGKLASPSLNPAYGNALDYARIIGALAFAALLLASTPWIKGWPRHAILAAFSLLLILDAAHNSRRYIAPLEHNDFMAYLEASTPPQAAADNRAPVRILQRGQELTNAFMAAGVGSVHGYHPITFARYDQLIRRLGFYDPRIPTLFHQNWYLWDNSQRPPGRWQFAAMTQRGPLLENIRPAPYATSPARVISAGSPEEALEKVAAGDFDPWRSAIAEHPDSPQLRQAAGRVDILEYGPGRILSAATVTRGGAVIFAGLMGPGWKAYAIAEDTTKPLDTFYANAAFRGAIVPEGHYELMWVYEPFSFRLGLFLSLAALAAIIAAWTAARAAGRTQNQTH